MINLRVETLIQPGRCQLSAPSMHKSCVQNMYMHEEFHQEEIRKNFCHEGATVLPFYLLVELQ